jgi:hypothetical protein
MTTNQKIRLRMLLGTRNFVNQNDATAKKIPKFSAAVVILLAIIDEIQLIGEMQGINKTGLAIDKNKLKKRLVALALKNSNKVAILAKLTSNDTLLKEVRFNESDLGRVSEVTLKERAKIVFDKAEANIESLAEQGITPDTQKVFLETITAFNNALETPRTGIAEKRQATQRLPVLFDKADSVIEIMDLAAASAKDEFPDFYNGYKTSRKLVDSNSGTLALKASAREFSNGEPLSGAVFVFKHLASMAAGSIGNGDIVKKTSKKGNFHVKSMEPGTYKVLVSKEGYKGKEVSVSISDGVRKELTVELEKV